MPDIDVRFLAVSVLFGALMGYGLGRDGDQRFPSTMATVACTLVGGVAWLAASEGSPARVAGVALTLGGAAAWALLTFFGRRPAGEG